MGIPDSSLQDLIEKISYWVSWGGSDLRCSSCDFDMPDNSRMCWECSRTFNEISVNHYCCQICGRWLCVKCKENFDYPLGDEFKVDNMEKTGFKGTVKCCKFCSDVNMSGDGERTNFDKVHPSASPLESPRDSPEPPSPCFSGETERVSCSISSQSTQGTHLECCGHARDCSCSNVINRSITSLGVHPAPVATRHSPSRSDDDEADDSGKHHFSPTSEYWNNNSDIDSSSISAIHEFDNFKSAGSSPSESPSRIGYSTSSFVNSVQQRGDVSPISKNHGAFGQEILAVLRKPEFEAKGANNTDDCSDDLTTIPNQREKSEWPLDFENNGRIWFPPPPDNGNEDGDSNFFSYDDDDDYMGDSGTLFSSSSSLSNAFPAKEKNTEGNKEPLKAVIEGHFRALVAQLLQGEGIKVGKDNSDEDWLDIVSTLAWQAANFVKPDRGGSMDPVDYVKVKCIASGSPSESILVKGVVCTKNIKHKRMTSQYKNPRLLLLGGALEYHKVPNELSSFDTLLQQEKDHLKMIISKIESHRTNVLLVEKSVSSCAQEYLLAKEISLVLNVKRPLLERIARCTGSTITPSIDHVAAARMGHCELFRLDRVVEEHENSNQFNKKPTKTLMFFEGCPRRLCCTVLLKGGSREELRKVKHVVQYAVFAAYHLSLETSFLADEGATLPKVSMGSSITMPERIVHDDATSETSNSIVLTKIESKVNVIAQEETIFGGSSYIEGSESVSDHLGGKHGFASLADTSKTGVENLHSDAGIDGFADGSASCKGDLNEENIVEGETVVCSCGKDSMLESLGQEEVEYGDIKELIRSEGIDDNGVSSEHFSAAESHHSILVYFSSHCISKGTVCEKSRLLRIKFYGSFDKPLGRYLCNDLFNETSHCASCKEAVEAHILCFTHQQGNLTINVRRLPSIKLPGENEGKIWMWHRCLRCAHVDGIPPATRRVVMSDAAWGLSFGKFLELSFSNHATANRVATCGHSLQRDCLRFYGFGNMVAFFRYSPINVHSVCLPPSVLEFNGHSQQEWIRKEAAEFLSKMETLYMEISDILERFKERSVCLCLENEESDVHDLQNHIKELKEVLQREKCDYSNMLQAAISDSPETGQMDADILELNRVRRTLLISSHMWDHRLNSLDSLLKRHSVPKVKLVDGSATEPKDLKVDLSGKSDESSFERNDLRPPTLLETSNHVSGDLSCTSEELMSRMHNRYTEEEILSDGEIAVTKTLLASHDSNLSDRIDSAWTGSDQLSSDKSQTEDLQAGSLRLVEEGDNPTIRKLMAPMRVQSFDSALRLQDRIRKGLVPSTMHLSALRSFHASGDYRNMVKDPVSNMMKTRFQVLPWEAQKLNLLLSSTHSFITTASRIVDGVRLLLPQSGHCDRVIAVYDEEPTSIISYALNSKEHEDWVSDKLNLQSWNSHDRSKEDLMGSHFTSQQSLVSLDLDFVNYVSYGSEDTSSFSSLFTEPKRSPHVRISFGDDSSSAGGSVKFSVTCYFAKQFDLLRKQCCPTEVDFFIRSLSRCRRWSAQGGKSNVYFAKTLDERFIVKQVTKTELESFEEFAPRYFKYLTESLSSGSPTCLAKVLGIYQVTLKYPKGGKETKMDLMVMENLFYKRSISRVYDLKGSVRSRYNPDTTGTDKVLLDMNLLETLRTKPIFLGSKAKRKLERAVWNDTSFLASVDVMDYSLLVGVDEERKELVLGIIDFMRQYTWDKHLETWVKASGILGGGKNASPTVISPKQYKKRFRKAMTTYFLTLPDHWSS